MKSLLVVMAHPDDAELLCYGTIKKYATQGYRCHLLLVTKGEQAVLSYSPAGGRMDETKNAFKKIDIEISCLHFTDGFLRQDMMLMAALQRQIEEIDPAVIITHFPDAMGLEHQDHSALGMAVFSSALRYGGSVERILYAEPLFSSFISFHPNLFVNIDEYYDEKIEMISCHASQEKKFYMDKRFLELRASHMSSFVNFSDNRFNGKYEMFFQAYAVEA
jgi:LmbE family N-acetylglucosaminyl deacetylase